MSEENVDVSPALLDGKVGQQRPRSIVGGAVIVTGTAVGAGMFSLPMVSADMGFGWSLVAMLVTWFCMLHVSLFILEVNLHYSDGASFDTFVRDILGSRWNLLNSLLLSFIFYILLYAYISGSGSIVSQALATGVGLNVLPGMSGCLFVAGLGFVVWLSTHAVDRLVSLLLVGMALTFLLSMGDLVLSAQLAQLFNDPTAPSRQYLFLFAALPFYLTSFGFQTTVPSLVKYYGHQAGRICVCLLVGSLLILAIYLLWQWAVFGHLSRTDIVAVAMKGGDIGALVTAIAGSGNSEFAFKLLTTFANFAIVTSFLGVGLGLFDFLADRFKQADNAIGRFKTSLLTFVPPLAFALVFPKGFLYAIGYAGLALAVSAVIIPPLMVLKLRSEKVQGEPDDAQAAPAFRVWGGRTLAYFILGMGMIYLGCEVLAMQGLLPKSG